MPIVLLVEDSEDDVFFFRHALKKTGFLCSFFHVGDGGAAIQFLRKAFAPETDPQFPRPDIVFLDLKLPTFSGFEILAWIKQQPAGADQVVTILSGSEHASDVERATRLGATSYLVKPISAPQLTAELGRLAAAAAARPANQG